MPSLVRHLRLIVLRIEWLIEWLGRGVAWLVLALALLTFFVALPRYLLNAAWFLEWQLLGLDWQAVRGFYNQYVNAMDDSVQFLHAVIFMVGIAYTLKHDDHVRIDIFYRRMGPRRQAWVNLLGTLLLLLPTCIFVLVSSTTYVFNAWAILEGSLKPGGLPALFVLKTFVLVMPALLLIQGVAVILRSLLTLLGHPMATADHSATTAGP